MMLSAVVLAAALVGRPPLIEPVLLLMGLWYPLPALAGLSLAVAISKFKTKPETQTEAMFLHAVSMELRAGANLRMAICEAARRNDDLDLVSAVRLAEVGAPTHTIADALQLGLPEYGDVTAAAVRTAGATGGRVAAVFESLAQVAAEDREMQRETKAATAQARVSAIIVGGMPLGFLAYQAASGRLAELLETGVGVGVLVVGGTLLALGATSVVLMLRRALA